jgi:aspartate racemase
MGFAIKTLGIVGGIAPESTIDYYRRIIALYRERTRDGSYPPMVITSIDMKRMLDLISARKLPEVTEYLLNEIVRLAKAGADIGIFASNTPHLVFDDIRERSPIPLVSIVEAACDAAKALGIGRVGLFGTRFTMQARFYPEAFAKVGISVVVPTAVEQDYIHDRYMSELVQGIYRAETREQLVKIVDRLKERENIEGLILGGTELPLLLREGDETDIPLLNTTELHVHRAINAIFA